MRMGIIEVIRSGGGIDPDEPIPVFTYTSAGIGGLGGWWRDFTGYMWMPDHPVIVELDASAMDSFAMDCRDWGLTQSGLFGEARALFDQVITVERRG